MYRVLCCGSNGEGQLGLGHDEDVSELQECMSTNHRMEQIACGSNHTVILLGNGDAYACGKDIENLVAHNTCNIRGKIMNFTRVNHDGIKFKKVAAGWDFTVLVDTSNKVYIYGDTTLCGGLGECAGQTAATDNVVEVFQYTNEDEISQIATSLHSVIILFKSGRMVAWGNNKKGQILGDLEKLGMIWAPKDVILDVVLNNDDILKVNSIAMGRDYTIFLAINLANNDRYIIMRSKNDRKGLLKNLSELLGEKEIEGTGVEACTRYFKVRKGIDIKNIESMWSSLHVLFTDGDQHFLKSFGNNVFNQLFPGIDKPIDRFDVGTEHGLCVTMSTVYSWGWGEHGNCGLQEDPKRACVFYSCKEGEVVDSIFGGYATSWVVLKKTG